MRSNSRAGRPHRGRECRQRLWISISGSSSIRRLKDAAVESGPGPARPGRWAVHGPAKRVGLPLHADRAIEAFVRVQTSGSNFTGSGRQSAASWAPAEVQRDEPDVATTP